MGSFLKTSLKIFVTYCVFIYSTQVFAGIGTSPGRRSEASEDGTRAIATSPPVILKPTLVASTFKRLRETDKTIQALHNDLLKRGFQAQTNQLNNYWGFKGVFKGTDESGRKRQSVNSFFYMQDYTKPGSSDVAALCQIQMNSQKYSFFLIATNGDFENATEFAKGLDGEISEKHANGFWHCMWHGLSGIGTTCANALITCPKTGLAAYVGCVAIACGGAALKRMACCACDCSWWCKWAAGCCDR